jgi:hypothetical protein
VVAEIESSGESVSGVARRHGLSPQQLFGWRRQVGEAQAVISKGNEVQFVPAIVDAAPPGGSGHLQIARRGDSIGTNYSSGRGCRASACSCGDRLPPAPAPTCAPQPPSSPPGSVQGPE